MDENVKNAIVGFLDSWKKEDWEAMMSFTTKTWAYTKIKADLQEQFGDKDWKLKDYKIEGFTNESNVKQVIHLRLIFADKRVERHMAILICEVEPYKAATFGEWGVNPVSVLQNFATLKKAPNAKGSK